MHDLNSVRQSFLCNFVFKYCVIFCHMTENAGCTKRLSQIVAWIVEQLINVVDFNQIFRFFSRSQCTYWCDSKTKPTTMKIYCPYGPFLIRYHKIAQIAWLVQLGCFAQWKFTISLVCLFFPYSYSTDRAMVQLLLNCVYNFKHWWRLYGGFATR